MGFNVLDILGDSRMVTTKCQNTECDRSIIRAITRYIQSINNHFQELRFHYIPKLENICAHFVAKEALKQGEGHHLEGGIPIFVRRKMKKKRLRFLA